MSSSLIHRPALRLVLIMIVMSIAVCCTIAVQPMEVPQNLQPQEVTGYHMQLPKSPNQEEWGEPVCDATCQACTNTCCFTKSSCISECERSFGEPQGKQTPEQALELLGCLRTCRDNGYRCISNCGVRGISHAC